MRSLSQLRHILRFKNKGAYERPTTTTTYEPHNNCLIIVTMDLFLYLCLISLVFSSFLFAYLK